MQLAEVNARRKQEADDKLQEQRDAKARLKRMAQEDLETKIKELQTQAQVRSIFKSQVDEVQERRRQEEDQKTREAKYERACLLAEERAAEARQAALDKENE